MSGVRRATVEDARAIAAVHVRSWQVAYRGAFPDGFLDGLASSIEDRTRWRISLLESPPDRATTLVIEANGTVAGFVDTSPTRDRDLDQASFGEVVAIYLDPVYWGQGLGRRLMAAAEEQMFADGFSESMLWVLRSNHRARRFYELAGWSHDGSSKSDLFAGHQVDEVRYRKSLSETRP